jgi:hypothetical protein
MAQRTYFEEARRFGEPIGIGWAAAPFNLEHRLEQMEHEPAGSGRAGSSVG